MDTETQSQNMALKLEDAQLPVVDLSGLFNGNETSVSVALGEAARTSGFFYISGHGIPQDQIDAVFAASAQFHSMPRSFKMKYWCGFSTNHRGYVPFEENGATFPERINFYDAWDMSFEAPADHPDHLAKWRMTGPNIWPEIDGWKDTVSGYYDAVFRLGLKLLDALALELQIDPQELRQHINYPTSQLRMLRYLENNQQAEDNTAGIDSHSDFECFTILLQGARGLQVMNADDYWVEAPPIPGTFIVNIGDIFETWSGGMYKSTQHRVVNTGKSRYSFPLFFGLDYHTTVQPLKKFCTPETLKKYPPIKAGEHLVRMSVPTFRYMNELVEKGDVTLDFDIPEESPFKREAKPLPA